MKTSTKLILYVLLSYQLLSIASSSSSSSSPASRVVSSVCSHTHDPNLCTSTSVPYAGSYPISSINAKAVLKMHLRATSKRSSSAMAKVSHIASKYPSTTASALKACGHLYANIIDLIGASIRALDANDQQSKVMVTISLSEVRQTIQQCDQSFQKKNVKNPMARFDASLMKMSINCDDLNNIM